MSNQFRRVAEMASGIAEVEVAGEKFCFSGEGVTVERKFEILFPKPLADEAMADHLTTVLGIEVPEGIVTSARAILEAYVPEGDAPKPDISDIVRMGINHPGAFSQLDAAASHVLGLTTPAKTVGGLSDWSQAYSILRRAYKKNGDKDLIKQAAIIAKAALSASGVEPEPFEADTEPTLEALRGNSEAASSDGS